MNGKKGLGLLLAGIAAYGIYKYNKMNAAEKKQLKDKVKAKGQKIYEKIYWQKLSLQQHRKIIN